MKKLLVSLLGGGILLGGPIVPHTEDAVMWYEPYDNAKTCVQVYANGDTKEFPCKEYWKIATTPDYPGPTRTQFKSILSGISAEAAPTWTATSSAQGAFTSTSFNHTISGSDTVLYVGIAIDAQSDFDPTCTYNSVGLTTIGFVDGASGSTNNTDVLRLVAPTTGTNTLACDGMDAGTSDVIIASSYHSVNQSTPDDTAVTSGGAQTSETDDVTCEVGDLVVDYMNVNGNLALTAGAGQTERYQFSAGAGTTKLGTSEEAGASTVTMSWAWDGTSQRAAHISFCVNAVPAAAASDSNTNQWFMLF